MKFLKRDKRMGVSLLSVLVLVTVSVFFSTGIVYGYGEFKGVTVNAMVETGPHAKALSAFAPAWEEITGAKINFTYLPGWPELYEKTKLELGLGASTTDIYYINMLWYPEMYQWLLPLDDLIEQPAYRKRVDVQDIVKLARDGATHDGKLYGFPCSLETMHLAYRKDLFDKYGIDKAPETLDELLDTAKKITHPEEEIYGFTGMGKRGTFPYWHYYWFLRAMGGDVYDAEGKPALDKAVALEALKYMQELYKYAVPASLTWDHFQAYTGFAQGQGAMIVLWFGGIDMIAYEPARSKVAWLIDDAVAPGVRLPDGSMRYGHMGTGIWYASINPNSKNIAAAFDFLVYATGRANASIFTRIAWEPVRYSALKDPTAMAAIQSDVGPSIKTAVDEPYTVHYMEMVDIIGTELSAVLSGIKSPEEALRVANERLKELD